MLRMFVLTIGVTLTAAVITARTAVPLPAAGTSCELLATVKLPDTEIVRAELIAAGAFTPAEAAQPAQGRGGRGGNAFASLPSFCRVVATLKPTNDSNIHVEVWLPSAEWNGKFQASGGAAGANSAVAGGINYPAMATSIRAGYATAGTDNGHQGATLSFAVNHPEKLVDFGYRATHEMTVKAKSIIEAFYGNGPRYSYWNACAAGGRQGLQEAQRYPADYDGIVVTAPANTWSRLQTWSMWLNQVANQQPGGVIPPQKYPAIHRAVVEQCDALDGVTDGILENPTRCRPKLDVLTCQNGDNNDCLTPPQLETARAILSPAVDNASRRTVYPAIEPGSELGWAAITGPTVPYYATETFKYLVFNDPNWTPQARSINLGADVATAERVTAPITADNPDLSSFFARGGKLIQVHGWTDPLIVPGDSIDYYNRVRARVGESVAERSLRLFMVPGMNHCQGGEGADTIEMQSVIERWVEQSQAPAAAVASKVLNGQVQRTHLLCPYPQEAVFKRAGSPDDANNFECRIVK